MSTQRTIVAVLAAHKRADWSDRTYACAGCRQRAEDAPVPPNETPEQMRVRWEKHHQIIKPDWCFADYNAHVAEHIVAALNRDFVAEQDEIRKQVRG